MTDLFRSAFNYLSTSTAGQDNTFVGQVVELGSLRLNVRKLLAEGNLFNFQ